MSESTLPAIVNFSTSEKTNELVAALIEAKNNIGDVIGYDSKNPHFKNRFASLEKTLTSINPKLHEQGLVLLQFPAGDQLISRLEHTSGQWMMSAYNISAIKKDPQQMGSAITYARRYCAQAIVGICGGEDDDAESATHGSSPISNLSGNLSGNKGGQSPQEIFNEFVASVGSGDFSEMLAAEWDNLMKKTRSLSDRKQLAGLLNSQKGKTQATEEEL